MRLVVVIPFLLIVCLAWRIALHLMLGVKRIIADGQRCIIKGLTPVVVLAAVTLLTGRGSCRVLTVACVILAGRGRSIIGAGSWRIGRIDRRCTPPIGTLGRRCRRAPSEFTKRISLSNQPREFRERIVSRRLCRATDRWFTCAVRSLTMLVRHSVPGR